MNSTHTQNSLKNPRLLPLVSLVGLCLAAGCLEFEEQTMTYRYDAQTDTLRIFQDYHGIFGADQTDRLSSQELDQLKSVLDTQRTFFFANWIFEFNRTRIAESLEQIQTADGRKELGVNEEDHPKLEALLRLLLENVRVENGAFYFDSQRRLSGVQRVTVTRASKVIAAFNDWLPHLLRILAANANTPAERHALYLKAATDHRDFVGLRGNVLTIRWPMTREDYDRDFGPQTDGGKALERFRKRGGRVAHADNAMTLGLGSASDSLTSLTLPMSKQTYTSNAVAAVKQQRATLLETFDAPAAAREFLKAPR